MTENKNANGKRAYIAIDMKSFYASVECVARGYDPLSANLLVADDSRTDKTICLAVSPALKAIGVPGRPRLFEAKRAISDYEQLTGKKIKYTVAVPRMALYEQVSAKIFSIILQYAAPEDVHIYSIDESFIDATPYLYMYESEAALQNVHPAHIMAMTIIRNILRETGITATVGIGTNLYLAKVAMDIVAKKSKADKDGVRIAELNEDSYKFLLWDHKPLTDFWMLGPGKARRLANAAMFTFGDVAERSQWNEEWFYKNFGIDAEILLAHAWGQDPVTIHDIKNYHSDNHSISSGQVLPRPYEFNEVRNVFSEMVDGLCADLFSKNLISPRFSWHVSYDYKSLEAVPDYSGEVCLDFYGRLHPKHSNGIIRMPMETNSAATIVPLMLSSFDLKTDHRLLFRRLNVCAEDVHDNGGYYQLSFLVDHDALNRERHLQKALLDIRSKYGSNSVFRGNNLLEGATQLERNNQIGGHRA